MKNLFKHLFDAGQGTFERIVSVILVLFGASLIVLSVLWSYGVGHNIMSTASQNAQGYTKLIGTVFLGGAIFWGYVNFSDKIPFKVSPVAFDILLAVLYIATLAENCGYLF